MKMLTASLLSLLAMSATAQAQVVGAQIAPGVTQIGGAPVLLPISPGQPAQLPSPQPGMDMTGPVDAGANPAASAVLAESGEVPNAYAQGAGRADDARIAERVARETMYRNTARQRGLVIEAPRPFNPVGSDRASSEWVMNWEDALGRFGVSPQKVRFEASRLPREEFERWASRLFRFHQAESNRLVVTELDARDTTY